MRHGQILEPCWWADDPDMWVGLSMDMGDRPVCVCHALCVCGFEGDE